MYNHKVYIFAYLPNNSYDRISMELWKLWERFRMVWSSNLSILQIWCNKEKII